MSDGELWLCFALVVLALVAIYFVNEAFATGWQAGRRAALEEIIRRVEADYPALRPYLAKEEEEHKEAAA